MQRDYDDILPAFAEVPQAALLGKPGSGKSTTLRRLALDMAMRAQQDPDAPLPLLAPLGNWTGDECLTAFLENATPEIGWATCALSKAKRLVLLLDGLNEMPTAKRAAKVADIRRLQQELKPSIVVSCRSEDYAGDLDLGFDTLSIEPLSPQRIRTAVRHWVKESGDTSIKAGRFFWQLAGDERLAGVLETWTNAGKTEDEFWNATDIGWERMPWEDQRLWREHIPNQRSLMRLASNPFMLTMLFQVWVEEHGVLPRNRGDLFRSFIHCLLSREGLMEETANGDPCPTAGGKRLLDGLADLAWRMQTERIGSAPGAGGDFGVLTVVSRADTVGALGGETLVKKALDATLLEGSGEVRFRHQLLQEYFTAQALQSQFAHRHASELWPSDRWWERSGWEETAVLLAGFHAEDCTGVIRWLADAQPEVAGQCVLQSGAEIANRPALLAELKTAWMPRLTGNQRDPQPEARAAVGRALGRLDLDTRKGVLAPGGVPDIDWVVIKGGWFLYQKNEGKEIDSFLIARYPVTNAQYEVFLDADDGYQNDRWWKGLTRPDRQPARPYWTESNHPRETVSWYEAMAFCSWLSSKLGRKVTLPTEWQWERAARWTDGRSYPWGAEYTPGYANIDETDSQAGPHYLRRTSPVGIYPEGASPEGVLDLSGNVWEWCLNEYAKPDRTQPGGEESRVVRGGVWFNAHDGARAGFRYYFHPSSRNSLVEFRVVCSSPIR